jgi:dolichol-phosphate mannosyltransferase
VIDGFRAAQYPILACMDCDLSHPPERILQMVLALEAGQQMVIGSRYVPGGSTDDDWGLLRWVNSLVATLLARPLTSVRDPMSGFFCLYKRDFEQAEDLNPVGYKIALELIVKCGFENVGEVPIHFTDRVHGESKLTLKEQLKYLKHLRRLYIHRFSNAMYLLQFLVVGTSGVVVNLAMVSLLLMMSLPDSLCLAGGIAVSVCTNFLLNRRFTFSYARTEPVLRQFLGFVGACAVGMVVNYTVALWLNAQLGEGRFSLQLAALGGIAAGMAFNFIGSRYVVFRKRFVKPK